MKDLEVQMTDIQPRYLICWGHFPNRSCGSPRNSDLQEQFLLHMGTSKNCTPVNISQTLPGCPGINKKDLEIPESTKEQAMVMCIPSTKSSEGEVHWSQCCSEKDLLGTEKGFIELLHSAQFLSQLSFSLFWSKSIATHVLNSNTSHPGEFR